MRKICELHNISQGEITLGCDNTSTLQILEPEYLPDPKDIDFDLTVACWVVKKKMQIKWNPLHIKGHQDSVIPRQELTREALLNIEVDKMAGAYWMKLVEKSNTMPQPETHEIYGEEWQLWKGHQKLIHPSRNNLYSLMQDEVTDMWWSREGHLPTKVK
jgi:hypothetical protein